MVSVVRVDWNSLRFLLQWGWFSDSNINNKCLMRTSRSAVPFWFCCLLFLSYVYGSWLTCAALNPVQEFIFSASRVFHFAATYLASILAHAHVGVDRNTILWSVNLALACAMLRREWLHVNVTEVQKWRKILKYSIDRIGTPSSLQLFVSMWGPSAYNWQGLVRT